MTVRRSLLLGALGTAAAPSLATGQPRLPCGAAGDVAGIVLEGSGAADGSIVTFGLPFAPGQVPGGAGLAARRSGGGPLPAQIDVVTRHADGSARFGVVALAAPGLRRGETAAILFAPAAQRPTALDAAALLGMRRQAVLEVGPPHGQPWRIDLVALALDGLARREALWQAGPLAVQVRVVRAVPAEAAGGVTSLRLVADVTIQADGVLRVDAWLRNDVAMQRGGGPARYDMRLLLDGRVALQADGLVHHQYCAWGRSATARPGGGPAAPPPHLRHDAERLADLGVVARYDRSTAIDPAMLEAYAAAVAAPGWAAPFQPRGIAQDMFATGGRADIGPATRSQAVWLLTGDRAAAAYSIGQAEAAGAVPWHFWDASGGNWLDTRRWPMLWTDPRGRAPPRGLLRQVAGDTGWAADIAHQPDLSYVPYLLTGRRAFLDGMQAQAAWSVMGQWPDVRGSPDRPGPAEGVNVVRGNQVRGAAWALRQLGDSRWATPAGDSHKPWIDAVEDANWAWLRASLAGWTREQGEAHGWIPPPDTDNGDLKPWQQDMIVSAAAAAARRGQPDARAVLAWMENFIAGRFLSAARGFNPRDGCAYALAYAPARPHSQPFDNWARIGAETVARGWSNGSEGWRHSDGNYGQWALQSLAAMIDVLGSAKARQAYAWLEAAAPPYTRPESYRADPSLSIVPRGRPRRPGAAPACGG